MRLEQAITIKTLADHHGFGSPQIVTDGDKYKVEGLNHKSDDGYFEFTGSTKSFIQCLAWINSH